MVYPDFERYVCFKEDFYPMKNKQYYSSRILEKSKKKI